MLQVYFWFYNGVHDLLEREEGQDLIEYAVLVFFIALIVIVVLGVVGTRVSQVFRNIATQLTGT